MNAAMLYDPANWADNHRIHAVFSQMRTEDPVHYHEHPDYPAFWHITKHADIFEIEKRTDVFLNAPRFKIATTARENIARDMYNGDLNPLKTLVSLDDPDHRKMRHLTQSWFMPKNLQSLKAKIDESGHISFNQLSDFFGTCDFAKDIALEFPLRVIMHVLGVPAEDYPKMLRLTQELFGQDDPDLQRRHSETAEQAAQDSRQIFIDLVKYFSKLTEDRKANPRDDVATIIANAEMDGKPIPQVYKMGYYVIIATAGHDTTSYSLTEAVYQLALQPELFAELKADPETIAPKVVEEAIRIASPVRHFTRTATKDFELRGKTIKAGDCVILWYPSGSRDEDIYQDGQKFDVHRDGGSRHAAFGHGAHICLGMHLARLENTRFLVQFANRVKSVELASEPQYMQSTFVGGIKSLPINAEMA